jgi:hypothetical protein
MYRKNSIKILIILSYICCCCVLLLLKSCYSFTGGNNPEYLKKIQIPAVVDNSGYGNPLYKDEMTRTLMNRFREDNTLTLTDNNGDCKLNVTISNIADSPVAISTGELETQRKLTVSFKVDYYDNVKKKQIYDKTFSNFQLYELGGNTQEVRDRAVLKIIAQTVDDILIATVYRW